MSDLPSCPFCGGEAGEIVDATRILGTFNLIHRCPVIGAFKIERSTREQVAAVWNTRALPAVPDAREAARILLEASDGWMPPLAKLAAVKAVIAREGKCQPVSVVRAWQAALRALIDNPRKEVMPVVPHANPTNQTDTAPAGLSAGGGADYDAVRQAIQKMTRLEGEYHIDRESADRALAFLNAREAKNCPAPRLLVEDGSVILTWVIGGWKMYQYCDEEETQAFSWQGPPATERGA